MSVEYQTLSHLRGSFKIFSNTSNLHTCSALHQFTSCAIQLFEGFLASCLLSSSFNFITLEIWIVVIEIICLKHRASRSQGKCGTDEIQNVFPRNSVSWNILNFTSEAILWIWKARSRGTICPTSLNFRQRREQVISIAWTGTKFSNEDLSVFFSREAKRKFILQVSEPINSNCVEKLSICCIDLNQVPIPDLILLAATCLWSLSVKYFM